MPYSHYLPKVAFLSLEERKRNLPTPPHLPIVPHPLRGEQALEQIESDEFGLRPMVAALADTLATRVTANSYVIGIEGSWGSGKSTFINFIREDIRQRHPNHRSIKFEPWLIGEGSAFQAHLLAQIADEIEDLRRESVADCWLGARRERKLLSKAAQKIRTYGTYAEIISIPAATLGLADPSGTTLIIAGGLKSFGKITKFIRTKAPTLEYLKSETSDSLRQLGESLVDFRLTVFVDDLDRLEPAEAVEVLRLVRKTADFPNVTYVLCFDRRILSAHVKQVIGASDGHDYIEKIFQGIVSIPPQEPFALRRFFRRLLSSSFSTEMRTEINRDLEIERRKSSLFDTWAGALLNTPRDAVRVCEAVKLGWPYLAGKADFFDFVWLQLIKLRAPTLYQWTQEYVAEVGAYRDGGRPTEGGAHAHAQKLCNIMEATEFSLYSQPTISYFLPGVSAYLLDGDKKRVFEFQDEELQSFEANRRLGSPTHWKQYFAFDMPSYAVSDDDILKIREAAKSDASHAISILRDWYERDHDIKGYFVDVLLERLADIPTRNFSDQELEGFTEVFAEVMDEFSAGIERVQFSDRSMWRNAYRVLAQPAAEKFVQLIPTGKSISWMTFVIRQLGFARQREGRDQPSSFQLTTDDFETAVCSIVKRFQSLGVRDFFKQNEPLSMLYCWKQLGDQESLAAFMATATKEDDGFLHTLDGMRNWATSSNKGTYYPLNEKDISNFLDLEETIARLKKLAALDSEVTSEQRNQANQLLLSLND